MKTIYEMNGTERAAALLVALGPKVASEILKHLDDRSIEKITVEIAKIDRLDPMEKEELIGAFLIDLRKSRRSIHGGEDKARELLVKTFGETRADEVFSKLSSINIEKELELLQEIEAELLHQFLKDEQPQTIAVALSYLPPEKSAHVLKRLSPEISKTVALKMAKMSSVTPEAVAAVARVIKKKYEKQQSERGNSMPAGGIESLVNILNYMPGESEKKIMRKLDAMIPEVSEKIRERIFVFENVLNLSNSEIRVLIDEINDDRTIARALKGAGDEVRFKFLRNMSQNRATDIISDMDGLGPLRLSEVEESRDAIVSVMKDLNDNGIISIFKEKEIYIE
jgi:flagellar motor switch protein FliG